MQNYMTSFQRMHAYAQIDIEDELNKKTDPKKGEWPFSGTIKFENVTMKYRQDMEPAVTNLTVEI